MLGLALRVGPYLFAAVVFVVLLIRTNRGKFSFASVIGSLTLLGVLALIFMLPPRRMPLSGLVVAFSVLLLASSWMKKS